MPELRFDTLRKEWVAYATERNDRTFLPTEFCPLCPTGDGGASEVPLDTFEVVVFENRFPAFGPDRRGGRPVRPPMTGCEVVVYTPEHKLTLAQLPLDRVRLLIDVWADRYRELGSRGEVAYVYIFENKGEEVGVTLHHPHGQIYALPFVPPFAQAELDASREHLASRGECLHCTELGLESTGPRRVCDVGAMVAFVPRAARWPYEVHVYPRRHVASIANLDDAERWDLAGALLDVAGMYDRHFGFSTPYVMAMHQAPTDGREWPQAHLHVEFYPPHRRDDRLKYLAGVELGAGTFVNDTRPEDTAAQLRRAVQKNVLNRPKG
ncbi:MAG: galactose-1-phosphate uridylyltransferase [Actinobacteria bacterium 13_1_20CM_2_65_11]|nr:MAG: galactose-1-phosphate uridylyltransferase [Chloroflexi bacterium 13_1_40CM_65_17]OLC68997.1 MAG: galactose-1-phosphate uridylyltransferase [Actinobacteria bacterium 13_1_40CM_4_65_12]OLD24896.1 MAG: galactose-1-phosphate uridylyltransferase [Chloroflexi bacterium 13_1_40CM_3_65_12]OLD48913.1 MAG: galactose-1-phosphate uridylyltransferase [Actinobacteria bacterium 13_1_40CM_2_65_8]OLE80841.1 MAG: galactose-1-phosphate uridylyltransferase [Actinobacteria bacterium 13_1_20CM_2_65_11]